MPNVGPGQATVTGTTGPGVAVTAAVLTGVTAVEVDIMDNTVKITWDNGARISYFDYSAITTFTWTITAGATAIVIS